MGHKLDRVDRGIVFLLQKDARNTTALDMANKLDVSASTIRNRIDQLEANDVLKGYYPIIDYENANLSHRIILIVKVPPTDQNNVANRVLDVRGVLNVRRMLIGRQYLYVEAVARNSSHLSQLLDEIHELGVQIDRSDMIRERQVQPLAFFEDSLTLDNRSEG